MDSTAAPTCLSPVGPIAQRWWEPSALPLALAPLQYPPMGLADARPKPTRCLLNRAELYSTARLEELWEQRGSSGRRLKSSASCVLEQAAVPTVPTRCPAPADTVWGEKSIAAIPHRCLSPAAGAPTMGLLLLALTLALAPGGTAAAPCPAVCVCDNLRAHVLCLNRNLTAVPDTIPEVGEEPGGGGTGRRGPQPRGDTALCMTRSSPSS